MTATVPDPRSSGFSTARPDSAPPDLSSPAPAPSSDSAPDPGSGSVPDPGSAPTGDPGSAPTGAGLDPARALAALLAGNRRFVQGTPRHGHDHTAARAAAGDQRPFAAVLGCVDSRVPAEAVFDQDFGAICVVRTAGQVLDQAVWGSLEFVVGVLRVPLVMVLGHTRCGAVQATVDALRSGVRPAGRLGYLVDQIAPAVPAGGDEPTPAAVTRAHVHRTVAALGRAEPLRGEVAAGAISVVGAVYDLDSGAVELLT